MFDADAGRDDRSNQVTRRVFVSGAMVAVAAFAVTKVFKAPGVEASTAVHGTTGQVKIVHFRDDGTRLDAQLVAKIVKTDGEWFRQLGGNSFRIARQADTEMPFSGVTWKEHRAGIYRCVCCETALFSSRAKFESGTGWPSFWEPLARENVLEKSDMSMGIERTEVQCARCEGHLGHVFSDGPDPTGLRYCMNSASLHFAPA